MNKSKCLLIVCIMSWSPTATPINLGFSSFLDGGPTRPKPGWYFQGALQYYSADKILNGLGKPVGNIASPHLNYTLAAASLLYQAPIVVLYAHPGISVTLPMVPSVHIDRNIIGITNSGHGLGDLIVGAFLQFKPIHFHGRPLLVQRLQFEVKFPTGKFRPGIVINPGSGFYSTDIYWAATLFMTPEWAASWRLYSYWNMKNKQTQFQEGQQIVLNYSTEYAILPNLWIGVNGYYLKQITDTTLRNVRIPNSKEQVLAVGPGILYGASKDLYFWGSLYFEQLARNRPQGINATFRFLLHF